MYAHLHTSQRLLSVNLRSIVDYALKTGKLKVISEYGRKIERNMQQLDQAMHVLDKSSYQMKAKYEEYTAAAKLQEAERRRFLETIKSTVSDPTAPMMIVRTRDYLLQDLAEEFYEQWQLETRQLLMFRTIYESLQQRGQVAQVIHDTLEPSFKSDDVSMLDDSIIQSIYELSDIEMERVKQAKLDAGQLSEDTVDWIQRMLREGRRRLRGDE